MRFHEEQNQSLCTVRGLDIDVNAEKCGEGEKKEKMRRRNSSGILTRNT
jgi:hypothetical protein